MTDLPNDRPDEGQPPAGGEPSTGSQPPTGAEPSTGGTPPEEGTQPSGEAPPPGTATPPGASTPPPSSTPPAQDPPAPAPQAQWPAQQQSGMTGSEQRNWAVGAHIGALAASVVTGLAFLAPLIVYLVKKDEDAFVREHAREALNFQLTWLLGGFVAGILSVIVLVVTVGFGLIVLLPAAIGFAIAWIVFMVKASMAASRGEYYRYPLTVRMIS